MYLRKYLIALLLCVSGLAEAQSANDPALLWSQATLYRDEWGVPHVYASNIRAMAFAFGYAQAEDHLETMLLGYRAANGRLSEIFGERYAAADEFSLMLGHGDRARQAYTGADFTTRDLCEGFALGVNHWLVQHPERAPAWAEGVQPTDILAFMHYYLMSQAPFDFEHRSRRPRGTPSGNAWAVAPSQSESGDAMLVINPHTAYDDLFQWYEGHLSVDGVNVAGATLYGLPVILLGHNEHLGWALTPNEADFADVYVESRPEFRRNPNSVHDAQLATEQAHLLRTMAASRPYYVRTGDGMREMRAPQQMTPHGPLIAHWAGRPIALQIGGYGDFGALNQLWTMASAANLSEFQAALTMHQLPCFHVVYADDEGNVFYLYNAKVGQKQSFSVPPRNPLAAPAKSPWDAPVSSIDTVFQWGAIVPPAYLPFTSNPESGFVQACASPPWLASNDTPEWNIDGLQWLVRDVDSYRAKRVRQLLSQGQRSFDDMQSMIFDPLSPFAVDVLPYLLALAEEMPELVDGGDPDLPAALDMLREWNHLADETSTAMTIFHAWWLTFREQCPIPVESDEDCYAVLSQPLPMIKEYALRALSEAVKRVRNEFQTINVPWGEVSRLWRGSRDVPVAGGAAGEPILVTRHGRFQNGAWPVTYGYGYAMAVKFGGMPEALSVVPFGTSDRPDSPHYRDQLDLFADRQMKKTHFVREAVERAARTARGTGMVFRPGEGSILLRVSAQTPVEASVRTLDSDVGTIPPGYVEFSRFVEPATSPASIPTQIQVEMTIPEALCARNNLGELGIYGYDAAAGWSPLVDQRLDMDTRTFIGRLYGGQRVAVLGPARLRRAPVMLASAPPSVVRAPSPIVPLPHGYTPLSEREPSVAVESPAVDAQPPVSNVEEAPAGLQMLSQPIPEIANDESRQPRRIFEVSTPPVSTTPEWGQESPAEAEPEPEPAQVASDQRETSPPKPKPDEKPGLQFHSGPLKDLVDPRYKARHTLFLVPENALASTMIIGTSFDLRPPVPGALFHISTRKTVRAQVQVLDRPPDLLPAGLAPFTHIFSVEYESRTVPGTVAVSLELEQGVCAAANFNSLALYSYDPDAGWLRVRNQDIDAGAHSFSALDFEIRTYAVLGPAEHLLRPPSS